ncbi:MAG: undecaprenyldiphospho-muramoylpentapeptide beta-N-acetylglucosaminyltransferase [Saprospiraceae bacterium]
MKVIISGGGSGGHIFPAIAIANALKERIPNLEVLFVGAEGKIEMEKVPKAGYEIEGLWISGFHRKLTTRNLAFPFKLLSSLWKAYRILQRFQPAVVIGVGGFASGPTLKVATWKGIPTLIQEQNSYPGITNRLLAKEVNTICVAYDRMERYFPKNKIVRTGNPVRQDIEITAAKRKAAYEYYELDPTKKTIFLFGGSLGARSLNDAMLANADLIAEQDEVQILWQAGKLYIEEFRTSATAKLPNVVVKAFIDRMDLAYAMADVVICRAGALTISELSLLGKTAILVPSPNVAEDHQTMNAKALVEADAAILVKDKDCANDMIMKALSLLDNEIMQEKLAKNITTLAKPAASNEIVNEILKLVPNRLGS